MLPQKKMKRKLQVISESTVASLCCPRCKKPFAEESVVRLKPRRKLSPKIQKLICRKRENEESLTDHQRELVHKALQCSNSLVLSCNLCPWKGENKLQTRKESHRQKRRLSSMISRSTEIQTPEAKDSNVATNKMTKKKMKKKERKKKVAERKALEMAAARLTNKPLLTDSTTGNGDSALSSAPLPSVSPAQQTSTASSKLLQKNITSNSPAVLNFHAHPAGTSAISLGGNSDSISSASKMTLGTIGEAGKVRPYRGSLGVQGPQNWGVKKRGGKQQLQKVLNQQKREGFNAAKSLSLFLNSLK